MLFSAVPRTDPSPSRHTESTYAFLDRCAKPGCEAIRRELQSWFDRYPASKQSALLRRMVADDFSSAFFELYLHELFHVLRLAPEVEPERAGGRPDFGCCGESEFLVEASVVGGASHADRGRRAMVGAILDAINQVPSPDYFLEVVEFEIKGPQQPSIRAITQFVTSQIEMADYESLAELQQCDLETLPKWVLEDQRVRLVIRPIPKNAARGKPGVRSIGIYPVAGGLVRDQESIRDRLAEKAKKFGPAEVPVVLAINTQTKWGADRDDVIGALFGSEQVVIDVDTREGRPSRARDGFFMGSTGPINTRISAVLVTSVQPWSVSRSRIAVFLNPWAKKELPDGVLPFDFSRVVDGHLRVAAGRSPGEVLGLPASWPEEND
ncbi:MAG: hypothetical protein HY700_01715 [Gemmatimonadetes bacterium]|nr:hypothetical protein [Gemmatimonadota bacterium]